MSGSAFENSVDESRLKDKVGGSPNKRLLFLRLQLHGAIYRPDSFVLMLRYCANLKAIRYESTNLNRIVADKLHRVIVALVIITIMKCIISKEKMSGPKRLIDSKAWCPLSFYLKCYHYNRNTRQKHGEQYKIKQLCKK